MGTAAVPHLAEDRATRLFILLAGFFVADALLAEFVGVKIFSLERTLGVLERRARLRGVCWRRQEKARGI